MNIEKTNQILALIRREVVPAMGCTEPIAVALATAHAARALQTDGSDIAAITCLLSPNIVKNAMGVGIPGTGMIGLPIAVALGAIVGKPEMQLEVLGDVNDASVSAAKSLISNADISVSALSDAPHVLHIDVRVRLRDGRTARAVISGSHTRLVSLECCGKNLLENHDTNTSRTAPVHEALPLTLREVWDFAMETPVDDLAFILETRRLNKAAAEWALMDDYGHAVGRTLHTERQRHIMGDSIFSRILSYTAAACDARMGGAPVSVMSNSGSGNQGIAATMPVVVYAEEIFADHEHTVRALTLAHLTSIYIKQSLGKLSALCGCVVATTGSAAGICYLMGGDYPQIADTVQNMAANLTGMICDGAKPSCALKMTSGVSTAVISAILAMEGRAATSVEGIVDSNVDRTIANFTSIGRQGMTATDKLILDIMTGK